jgi:hypothetical protein
MNVVHCWSLPAPDLMTFVQDETGLYVIGEQGRRRATVEETLKLELYQESLLVRPEFVPWACGLAVGPLTPEFVPCAACSLAVGMEVVHTAPECEVGKAAFSTSNKEYEDAERYFRGQT